MSRACSRGYCRLWYIIYLFLAVGLVRQRLVLVFSLLWAPPFRAIGLFSLGLMQPWFLLFMNCRLGEVWDVFLKCGRLGVSFKRIFSSKSLSRTEVASKAVLISGSIIDSRVEGAE